MLGLEPWRLALTQSLVRFIYLSTYIYCHKYVSIVRLCCCGATTLVASLAAYSYLFIINVCVLYLKITLTQFFNLFICSLLAFSSIFAWHYFCCRLSSDSTSLQFMVSLAFKIVEKDNRSKNKKFAVIWQLKFTKFKLSLIRSLMRSKLHDIYYSTISHKITLKCSNKFLFNRMLSIGI